MGESMRVLFIMSQDLDSPNGTGRIFPLARNLYKRGHEVHIVALHANYSSLKQTRFESCGVKVWYVSQMHVLKRGNQKFYFSPLKLIYYAALATVKLTLAALSIPADIIHIAKPQPMNSLAGLIARGLKRNRLLLDYDDLESANNRFGGGWQRRVVKFFEKNVPRWADHVTTHTFFLRDRMISEGIRPNRICYLPHGMDLDRFRCPEPHLIEQMKNDYSLSRKRVIIFVGSISLVSHALDILVKAMPHILLSIPEAVLLLVGGGEDFERLENLAQELKLGDSVRFAGRMEPDRAALAYRLGRVSVAPVKDNEAGRAALSIKIFESWAADIPLVTVDVGDNRRVIGDPPAAVLVPPGDPEMFAQAVVNVLSSEELAQTLVTRGQERAKEYSWDFLAERVEGLYYQILSRKQSGRS
jgi:glycosyltransferase involved in cell wall biosynthesis